MTPEEGQQYLVETQPGPTTSSADKLIQYYVQVRDRLAKMDDEHKEKRKPLLAVQEELAGKLTTMLETTGAEALRTEFGTCYTSVKYSASLADPDAFMRYVIDTKQFDLLDRRANSTAVKDHVKSAGGLPPGCNLNAVKTLNVRRAS